MRLFQGFKAVLTVLIFCLLINCASAGEVKFVQFTDVHINHGTTNRGGRMLKHSKELFNNAIQKVNSFEDIDFVVFTGDLTDIPAGNLIQDFGEMANQLNANWYWTTGNHDVGPDQNKKDFLTKINLVNHKKRNKTYYSFTMDDFVFICMDGTIEDEITAHARFSKEELDWLDKELIEHNDKFAVIFQHFPLVEPFKSLDHYILNNDEYFDILDKHKNVAAVMTGHYHAAKITERNGVLHVSSPSLMQYPNAFRVVTLSTVDDGVKVDFEYMPTPLSHIRQISYKQTGSSKMREGRPEDRETSIILKKPLSTKHQS